jgi:hypothetical protein
MKQKYIGFDLANGESQTVIAIYNQNRELINLIETVNDN